MENKPGLIYEKIPLIMAEIGAVGKGGKNKAQGYEYRSIDDVMAALQPIMAKHGVSCIPEVYSSERQQVESSKGTQLLYSILNVHYTFYAEDGSFVVAATIGEGMDTGDKASNKAMAAAMKYVLTQTFCIPTEENKDSEKDDPQVGAQTEPKKGWVPEEEKPSEPPAEDVPDCMKCGNPMKRRDGKKGPFWGCSGYPDCDGTKNIEAEQQTIPTDKPKSRDECRKSLFQVAKDKVIKEDLLREWVKSVYVGKGISDMDLTKLRALEKWARENPDALSEKVTFFYQQKANDGEPVSIDDGGDAAPF